MQSRLMTRREQLVLAFVAAAIVLGAGVVVWRNAPAPQSAEASTPQASAAISVAQNSEAVPSATPAVQKPTPIVVSIQGAVRNPDVYKFTEGDRVNDLLAKAGGGTEDADLRFINLAARLVDGTTLTVPTQREDSLAVPNPEFYILAPGLEPAVAATTNASTGLGNTARPVYQTNSSGKIDLNRASSAELQELPGVGPAYADAIIAYRQARPFERIEEIQNVRGIGPKRYEAMRDLIVVNP